MILITKCPHCQTTFRVTDDQLKLYDGAVRCGVCQQIFNGTDHIQTEPPVLTDKTPVSEKKKTPPAPAKSTAAPASDKPAAKASPAPKTALPPGPSAKTDDITISLTDDVINASSESEALFDALEEELSTISLELGQVTGQLFGNALEEVPHEEDEMEIAPSSTEQVTINEIVGNGEQEKVYTRPPVKPATTRFASLSPHPDLGAPAKNTVYSTAPRLDDVAEVAPSTTIEAEIVEPAEPAPSLSERARRLSAYDAAPDPLMDGDDRYRAAFFEMAEETDTDDDLYTDEPDFVRKGRRKKRAGLFSGAFLSLATLVLLLTLAVQFLYMFSDRIVVWWPPAESTIAKTCHLLSCPRRLETRISSLSIESSELQTVSPLTDKYSLSLLVRNSGSAYQSWPHIELTLTDPDKKPVVRRAFAPANYLPDAERIIRGIAPYSEESVRLYLEMQTGSNVDYRISLFYP
ncbi:zinc-ribbon domain-containing protein [Oxalobacter sp. OttesenSCG-928-P03]|nr:zinc-ribbon domain-containing protein [Oxalobacter sp. OttesenSCG-928-P03]